MNKATKIGERSNQEGKLLNGEYGAERGTGEVFARPPQGPAISLKGADVSWFPDRDVVTVMGEIDNGVWKGRLVEGVWYADGEKLPGEE